MELLSVWLFKNLMQKMFYNNSHNLLRNNHILLIIQQNFIFRTPTPSTEEINSLEQAKEAAKGGLTATASRSNSCSNTPPSQRKQVPQINNSISRYDDYKFKRLDIVSLFQYFFFLNFPDIFGFDDFQSILIL